MKNNHPNRGAMARWTAIVAASAVTGLAVLLTLNLTLGNKYIDSSVSSLYATEDPQFLRTMGAMLGPPVVPGNRVQALVNGEEIFPAMLAAIEGARRSVTFETYVYWSGTVGRRFSAALAERARAGVPVLVLLDAIGADIDEEALNAMRSAGVAVRRYNPVRWTTLGRLNNRTHRKLLVVDGRTGFTGGAGIADQWLGDGDRPGRWRDTHYQVEGPVVAQMQAAFMDNWLQAQGALPHGSAYFPPVEAVGDHRAQVYTSSPGGGTRSMQTMYLLSISAAARSIRLSAAYFVPDDIMLDALVAALRRGVRIQIILPGPHMDHALVGAASESTWGRLLDAGAEIHLYQPSMYHCKVLIVDEIWTSVGSTNFDNRSFAINDEANLNIYDRDFALEQVRIFERDLARSPRVTRLEWQARSWAERIRASLAGLLSSQL